MFADGSPAHVTNTTKGERGKEKYRRVCVWSSTRDINQPRLEKKTLHSKQGETRPSGQARDKYLAEACGSTSLRESHLKSRSAPHPPLKSVEICILIHVTIYVLTNNGQGQAQKHTETLQEAIVIDTHSRSGCFSFLATKAY